MTRICMYMMHECSTIDRRAFATNSCCKYISFSIFTTQQIFTENFLINLFLRKNNKKLYLTEFISWLGRSSFLLPIKQQKIYTVDPEEGLMCVLTNFESKAKSKSVDCFYITYPSMIDDWISILLYKNSLITACNRRLMSPA